MWQIYYSKIHFCLSQQKYFFLGINLVEFRSTHANDMFFGVGFTFIASSNIWTALSHFLNSDFEFADTPRIRYLHKLQLRFYYIGCVFAILFGGYLYTKYGKTNS